jgi:hypothetical protein
MAELPDIEIEALLCNEADSKNRALMVAVNIPEKVIRAALAKHGITQESVDNPEGRSKVFERARHIDEGVGARLAQYLRKAACFGGETIAGDHKLATIGRINKQKYVFSLTDPDIINHLATLAREENAPLDIEEGVSFRRTKISPRVNPDAPPSYREFERGIRAAIISQLGLEAEYPNLTAQDGKRR